MNLSEQINLLISMMMLDIARYYRQQDKDALYTRIYQTYTKIVYYEELLYGFIKTKRIFY